MEFLHAPIDDSKQVMLVLVVSRNGTSRLVWYNWDPQEPLHQAQLTPNSRPLPKEEQMPLLLIPMLSPFSFALISEGYLTLYKDLLTPPATRIVTKTEIEDPAEETGASRRAPTWVQWARILRPATFRPSSKSDGIYLCREDGVINFLEITHKGERMHQVRHPVGRLQINVDSAFAALDFGPQRDDVLAVGGDGCDGGLWRLEPRKPAQKLASHPNWTPMTDTVNNILEIVNTLQQSELQHRDYKDEGPKWYACCGGGRYGSAKELRLGFPAPKIFTIDLDDEFLNGVLGIWALSDCANPTVVILLALPKQTFVAVIRPDSEEPQGLATDIIDRHEGLDLHNRTLAAKLTSAGRLVQITEGSIHSSVSPSFEVHSQAGPTCHDFGGSRAVVACIGIPKQECLTVIALKDSDTYRLEVGSMNPNYTVLNSQTIVSECPTALSVTNIEKEVVVFTGSADRTIRVYCSDSVHAPLRQAAQHFVESEFSVCESIAYSMQGLVTDANAEVHSDILIACGMRNGEALFLLLQCFESKCKSTFLDSISTGIKALHD